MEYDEFLARVRERGEFGDRDEADRVATAVLEVLASRITGGAAAGLAARLPAPLDRPLRQRPAGAAASFGVADFVGRVADLTGARTATADWDVGAVLSTVADCLSDGELDRVLGRLPDGYATLFGKPDLTG